MKTINVYRMIKTKWAAAAFEYRSIVSRARQVPFYPDQRLSR